MKCRISDILSYLFFALVMLGACWLTTFWTDDSLVYKLLYEGI